MGWSIGYDDKWKRDIGYGVPATCDHPGCGAEIDRGLSYVCGGEAYGGDKGCGLYFCSKHLYVSVTHNPDPQMCSQCCDGEEPCEPTPDVAEWIEWKLTDDSWKQWRHDNPKEVKKLLGTVNSQTMRFA